MHRLARLICDTNKPPGCSLGPLLAHYHSKDRESIAHRHRLLGRGVETLAQPCRILCCRNTEWLVPRSLMPTARGHRL